MNGDQTELFNSWVECGDCVTVGEMLDFASYANWTISKTIARLREADIELIPEHQPL